MVAILSPLSIYGDNRKTKILLKPKVGYTPTKDTLGICLCSTIEQMLGDRPSRSLDASLAIPMCVLCFEASRHARIPSPPAEPPVLILRLNQVTGLFCGEPPQTPLADFGCELPPCIGSCPRLRLAFLATMRPALDPAGHRVSRLRPTCLSTPRRPRKA
jgi:hypothetical protein